MILKKLFYGLAVLAFSFIVPAGAQEISGKALESITAAELRDHIFFLASDYLNGRVATSPEYQVAAQYVATQFAAAGLEPAIKSDDGTMTYFQGVPFARTIYSDKLVWRISKDGEEREFIHGEDFKVLMGNEFNHDKLEVVWAGYGISEPRHKWDDLKDIDFNGKIAVCIAGAPEKKGKPVLPREIHDKYTGSRGLQTKLFSGLFQQGVAGIILIDVDGSAGMDFDRMNSEFSNEKVSYKGGDGERGRRRSFPSIYLAKPEILETIIGDQKFNPLKNPDNILKNYKPQKIEGTYLDSNIDIVSEDIFPSNNVIGIVPGTDPELKNEYIVVGGHLDHVRPRQGEVCNGADDNASGSAGVIEIAEAMAMNPGRRTVIFAAWTAEEMGLIGSRHFVSCDAFPKDKIKFNLNLDMIGRTGTDNEESRAHYAVTHKKYVDKLGAFINETNDGITDFPIILDNDEDSPGGSDHQSFISEGIPGFFFFSGVHKDLHQPGDDPEKIDYPKAESISRLAYLITSKLANIEEFPDFQKE